MYCPRCGQQNEDSDRFCSACGQDLATYRRLWAGTAARGPVSSRQPEPDPRVATQPPTPGRPSTPRPEATLATEPPPHVPSYLGWAAALLTCCWPAWPAGVAALVFASRTESLLAAGDLARAQGYSQKAKTWCWITLAAGLILWAMVIGVIFSFS